VATDRSALSVSVMVRLLALYRQNVHKKTKPTTFCKSLFTTEMADGKNKEKKKNNTTNLTNKHLNAKLI